MAAQLVFDRRPPAVMAVNDSLIMIRRSCTHIIRNTDQLLGAFFQPIMFLVLFAAVFGGAISKALPPGTNYLDFLMPRIIAQTLAFGSTTTPVGVNNDLQKGIIHRFRSLPTPTPPLLISALWGSAAARVVGASAGHLGRPSILWRPGILLLAIPLASSLSRLPPPTHPSATTETTLKTPPTPARRPMATRWALSPHRRR